jgi:hypothetical protein
MRQLSKASAAALTASATSSWLESGKEQTTSLVSPGFSRSSQMPLFGSVHRPFMKFRNASTIQDYSHPY